MDIEIKEEPDSEIINEVKNIKQEINEDYDIDTPDVVDPASLSSDETQVTCEKCNSVFSSAEDLEVHDIIHTNDTFCSLCKKWFSRRSELVIHVRTHLLNKSHKCEQCLRSFVTKKELKLHTRVHTNERPFQCSECDKAFKQRGALIDHKLVHTKQKSHSCPLEKCDTLFTTKSSVRRHLKRIHKLGAAEVASKINNQTETITCAICQQHFSRKCDLYAHTRQEHQGTEEFNCQVCQKSFNSYFVLTVHMEDKHKPKTCNICEQSFAGAPELSEHLKEHHKCGQCGQGFISKVHLTGHIKLAHDSSIHRCQICFRKFTNLEEVAAHVLTHKAVTPLKKVPCTLCNKRFRTRDGLTRHLKMFHYDLAFVCNICGRCHESPETLKQHMKKHDKYKAILRFTCSVCLQGFRFKPNLLNHYKEVHPQVNFKCQYCGKDCTNGFDMFKHQTRNCPLKTDNLCNFCNKNFNSSTALKTHYRIEHARQFTAEFPKTNNATVNSISSASSSLLKHALEITAIKNEVPDSECFIIE
ncbi:unnamed protein product [Brassicogethes aeneus]|uniref:C2H2-type domain-containing protein n=1 Tax=Brassicogethes aeneus TaxID=1431903 RepID=A0A9P0FRH9_BRAAE|nr:unnamed protein product [Brassicogethes aeneus]